MEPTQVVVSYARVSKTDDQQDPQTQIEQLRKFAELKGWKIVREYVDRCSGAKESRPAFDQMMRDLTKGLIDVQAMMVWKVDRLGRSVRHLHNVVAELKEAGVAFVSTTDGVDLTTPLGEAMFGMLAVMAQFERALISERTKATLVRLKASGIQLGRPCGKQPSRTTLWRRKHAQLPR